MPSQRWVGPPPVVSLRVPSGVYYFATDCFCCPRLRDLCNHSVHAASGEGV